MEKEFVPKKTITVQLTIDLYRKFEDIVRNTGQTKTKLIERLINNEYQEMEAKRHEA